MSQIIKQKFSVQIHQLFRTAGFTMNITQTEQLQLISDKLVELIEETAKERSVELIRKMQEAVGAGFTKIGKDIDAIEVRLNDIQYNPVVPASMSGPKFVDDSLVGSTDIAIRPLTDAERDAGFTSEND